MTKKTYSITESWTKVRLPKGMSGVKLKKIAGTKKPHGYPLSVEISARVLGWVNTDNFWSLLNSTGLKDPWRMTARHVYGNRCHKVYLSSVRDLRALFKGIVAARSARAITSGGHSGWVRITASGWAPPQFDGGEIIVTGCQDHVDQATRNVDSTTVVSKNLFGGRFRHRVRFFASAHEVVNGQATRRFFQRIENLVNQELTPGEIESVSGTRYLYQDVWSFDKPRLSHFKRVAMMAKLAGHATNIKFEECVLIEEIVAQASTDK